MLSVIRSQCSRLIRFDVVTGRTVVCRLKLHKFLIICIIKLQNYVVCLCCCFPEDGPVMSNNYVLVTDLIIPPLLGPSIDCSDREVPVG